MAKPKRRSRARRIMGRVLTLLAIFDFLAVCVFVVVGIRMIANDRKEVINMSDGIDDIERGRRQLLKVLDQMTLKQKVGQMIIVSNNYTSMVPEFEAEIADIQPGGYIIFAKNITTLSGTKQFTHDIQGKMEDAGTVELKDGTEFRIPAFLSVDQEGGIVQRLQAISDYPPAYVSSMREIGVSGSPDKAYETGRLLGEEVKSVGLNLDYAPVADILSNPQNTVIGNRAFGTDRDTVATMSVALARGLDDTGVIPVFKHFPGHGDTVVDSHHALPVVTKNLDELMQNELYPFQEAIKEGAEMIMVAHIALPNVTGDYTPASLSSVVVKDVLKGQMGYDGLVVTDGLDMGALTNNYSNGEIAVRAVAAGADLLLMPVSPAEARDAILAAVEDGTIDAAQIDESVFKILDLKMRRLK